MANFEYSVIDKKAYKSMGREQRFFLCNLYASYKSYTARRVLNHSDALKFKTRIEKYDGDISAAFPYGSILNYRLLKGEIIIVLCMEDFDILNSESISDASDIFSSFRYMVVFEKEDDLLRCRVLEVYTDRGSRWAVKSALVMLNTMTGYVADMPLSYNFLNNSRLFLEV